jgi:signal transduction histidine kinase
VSDDGTGFDPVAALRSPTGLGLTGLRERAARMHGVLRLDSQPGRGADVVLTVPVEKV